MGIWRRSSFGSKYDKCFTLFQEKCSVIKQVITKRIKLFKKALQRINKPHLVDDDSKVLLCFARSRQSDLIEDRKWLKRAQILRTSTTNMLKRNEFKKL